MVGFLGAIAGGAMKGWSQGTLQEIKDRREEKLHMLDQQFLAGQNELNRDVQRQQIASQERLTTAGQAIQERLGNLQSQTTKSVAELQAQTTKEVNQADITSREGIAKLQADNAKTLQQMQIDANAVPELVQTQTGATWVVKKNGKVTTIPAPIDPSTGKPLDPLFNKNDTPEITNFKYLMSRPGMDPNVAQQLAFGSKNADPTTVMAGLYKANLESSGGDFSSGTSPEERAAIDTETKAMFKNWQLSVGQQGQPMPPVPTEPAAGSPDATAPAAPTSATTPQQLTPGQKQAAIAAAKKAVLPKAEGGGGKDPAAVRAQLKAMGITPAEAGL